MLDHPSSSPQGSPRSSISVPSAEQAAFQQMQQQMQVMYQQIQQQQQQLQATQQAAAHAATQQVASASAVARPPEMPKIRQPSSFSGAMGFVVDDWISEMQQQFAYYGTRFPDDAAKVRFAVVHLTGAAMHWWEHQEPTTVWSEFIERLHGRFRPVHAAMLARQKLGRLRQRAGQSVNQYVGVFQNTLTPIIDMGAMDQVHHFVTGLLAPIAAKVWEKHPTNLIDAIDAAVSVEAMSNFGRAAIPGSFGRHPSASSSAAAASNPDAMDLNNLESGANDSFMFQSPEADQTQVVLSQMVNQMAAMDLRLNALFAGGKTGSGRTGKKDRIPGLDAATIKELQAAGKCFRCKEKGHMKNECPKKPKN